MGAKHNAIEIAHDRISVTAAHVTRCNYVYGNLRNCSKIHFNFNFDFFNVEASINLSRLVIASENCSHIDFLILELPNDFINIYSFFFECILYYIICTSCLTIYMLMQSN